MKFIYPAIFSKTTEGTFEARFPDLECCTATGETLDDCIENANQAAYDWIYVELTEFDSELPPITDPDDLVLSDNETLRNISVNIRLTAPFIRALMVLLKPFIWMFAQWKKLLVKLFNKPSDERGITDEELMTIVEEAEQEGGIDADESTLIRSAIGFMDLETSDIYTPRVDIESIPLDATKEEIAKMFLDTGFSRLPVYEEDIDHIIGIINQKDFHNFIYHTDRPLKDIIRPVLFITPTMKIGVLLKKLQDSKTHIAIILDEFGGTEGLVTIEDIIEELVGDIWDEHDRVIKEIEKISDREYLMSGSANIDKVFELLDIEKAVDVNTLSGWIMEELGQIPKEGDSFVSDGVKVVVLKMDDHRVDKVKVYKC